MSGEASPSLGASPGGYEVRRWMQSTEALPFAGYWNDEVVERAKAWHIGAKGLAPMEAHLAEAGLLRQLDESLEVAGAAGLKIFGQGADLACGTAWASAHLLRTVAIERIFCVEYSEHRLLKLAPALLAHYEIAPERVVLCLGSFYELNLPDHSLDFVLLSEAFHHAGDPRRLLAELRRVLKRHAAVLIIGEHDLGGAWRLRIRNAARLMAARLPESLQRMFFGRVVSAEPLFAPIQDMLRPDPIAGDHYYLREDYMSMFSDAGFEARRFTTRGSRFQGFVLELKGGA